MLSLEAQRKLAKIKVIEKRLKEIEEEKRQLENQLAREFGYDTADDPEESPKKTFRKCRTPGCDFQSYGRGLGQHYRASGH